MDDLEVDQRSRAGVWRSRGVLRGVLVAGLALMALVTGLIVVVRSAAGDQQRATSSADHSALVLNAAQLSEREVVDLETGVRGYAATGARLFLAPWYAARAGLPSELARLRSLVTDNPAQARAALALQTAITGYVSNYAAPMVNAAQPPRGSQLLTFMTVGKTRVDALRARFASFDQIEQALQDARGRQMSVTERRFALIALFAGVMLLLGIASFVWFVVASAVLPLRRAITACARVAAGEREVSLPATGPGELIALSATFNAMVAQLRERERELHVAGERARAKERQLSEAQAVASVGSWEWELARPTFTFSDELCRLVGRPVGFAPSLQEFVDLIHPDDREAARPSVEPVARPGVQELDFRIVRPDGEVRHVSARRYARLDESERVTHLLGTVQDVTELQTAERARREAQERFERAFDDAPIGMALIALDGRIEQANEALGVISERTRTELEGLRLSALMHPADRKPGDQSLQALVRGQSTTLATEIRFLRASGPSVDVFVHGTVLSDGDGRPTHMLCQFQDVTERKRFESQLQFMADHDPLTGLLNRRKFEIELDRHVAQVKRYGAEGALIALDIDNFKQINDTLGHHAGDQLIVSIAGVLSQRLRESDVLARLGGDEFAVLLPKADAAEAARVAEAILHAVRTKATLLDGEHKRVTASVGVAMFKPGTADLSGDSILVEADLAMYDAKEVGRDNYAFYSTSEHEISRTKSRLTWVDRIEYALEHDRFRLAAQPILDLHNGQVRQHELLIRMLGDRGDLVPPATFLYIAERVGLMGRIDAWVTSQAIDLLEQRPELQLEVNISGRSLGDPQLLDAIEQRLRNSPVDPSRLIFEVTETAAVANVTQAQVFARHLRDLGCRFALDDFGAGFGSFYYLKHLPFDFVKIDGEFVQHVLSGNIDRLVIEAVVRIAQGLGKETIAEFVTDEKTQRMVARLGVDYAQGYHIGKPTLITDLFALDHA